MKILIVSNCNNPDPTKLEDCTTRIELFVLLLKIHLSNIDGIELLVMKCYPYLTIKPTHTNLYINQFPITDHTLFIDETGFYKKNATFFDQLRKVTKYSIFTFCNHIKFSTCEDITFTFAKNTHDNKVVCIPPPLNDVIYAPRKDTDSIYILLNKPSQLARTNDTNIPFILKKISKLVSNESNTNIIFKIGLIDHHSVDYIDTENNIIETKEFPMYIDFIYELSKANMFFITSLSVDTYLLYELAMCNTLIIAKNPYIDKHIVDELKVYTYDTKFKWDEIFKSLLTYNIRSELIDNKCSWGDVSVTIINRLRLDETKIGIKELSFNAQPSNKQHVIRHLNIKDKNKPCINKMAIPTDKIKTKDIRPKKLPVFLQSQLLK